MRRQYFGAFITRFSTLIVFDFYKASGNVNGTTCRSCYAQTTTVEYHPQVPKVDPRHFICPV